MTGFANKFLGPGFISRNSAGQMSAVTNTLTNDIMIHFVTGYLLIWKASGSDFQTCDKKRRILNPRRLICIGIKQAEFRSLTLTRLSI